MHVLIIPSWYPKDAFDVVGSFFREQAIALRRSGVDVGVIAASIATARNPSNWSRINSRIETVQDEGVATYRCSVVNVTPRIDRAINCRYKKLTSKLFDSYVADNGLPDLLHVHSALRAGIAACDISRKYGIPFIISEHSSDFARAKVSAAGLSDAKFVVSNASAAFAVSSPFSKLLESEMELAPGTVGVMPNPVDDKFLNQPIAKKNTEQFSFLHISLLDENKNVPALIDAFAILCKEQSNLVLKIGGDGPTRRSLEKQAQELGIANRVRFLGALSRDAVVNTLSDADAFVLPSRFESFGVVLVEALAMGVPVIATRSGGPEDVVKPGDGLLVDQDDITGLSRAMRDIIFERGHKSNLLRRDRCKARFSSDFISKKWISIYQDILRSAGRPH